MTNLGLKYKGRVAVCQKGILGVVESAENEHGGFVTVWKGTTLFSGRPWESTQPTFLTPEESEMVRVGAAYMRDQQS